MKNALFSLLQVVLEETQDLTADTFRPLLDFIYTGKLLLSKDTVFDILACSCFLAIESATQVIVGQLSTSTVHKMLKL